ncbi:MAG: class I SAM-dependent methyltransferase [Calditrichia bacterium]|nr:class I SAM-dependent methyltransferase [Calditrichia bacterium]MCK5455423.1 class I SAM-dependent methyltransferase [Calditrichia bacterium]
MAKNLWKLQSSFYHLFRSNPVSAWILQEENEAIKLLFKSLPDKRIRIGLDIGSGRGNSLELFIDSETAWVAIDYSLQMIRRCRPQFQEVRFILGDVREMPFKGGSFDLVLSVGVSEYLEDPDQFLREIWKLLKPGSFVILTLTPPNFLNFFRWMIGHRIYTIREADLRDSLNNIPFSILGSSQTLLQDQYLLRKDEGVENI